MDADAPVVDWPALPVLDGSRCLPGSWQQQPAVVVVWATCCGHCQRHNIHTDRLYRVTQGQGLRVPGIAVDTDEAQVRGHVARNRLAFPVVLDDGRLRERLSRRQGAVIIGAYGYTDAVVCLRGGVP